MLSEDIIPSSSYSTTVYSYVLGGLGAFGVALQNYPAVEIFIKGLANGIPASRLLDWSIQATSWITGGLCSGLVNFWMNVELLEGFFQRMLSEKEFQYKRLKLSAWQILQYFGGIFVFVVTGFLFGLMAFTFAMAGPLAILSIVGGVFVAGIMTIQEVETWLSSYENTKITNDEPLTNYQQMNKWIGHIIAIGNVLALSTLFTLSLTSALMMFNVAAFPALIIGFSVAFTFGAFTEYYFYNFYLSDFCKNFTENWFRMLESKNSWLGLICVSINAFVNAALTYAGMELLMGLLLAANITLPPVGIVIALAALSAFFTGSASFILGLDFWIRQNPAPEVPVAVEPKVSLVKSSLSVFAANEREMKERREGDIETSMLECSN